MAFAKRRDWMIPLGLVSLSFFPIVAGSMRLHQVVQGIPTEENSRFLMDPLPVIFHIVAASIFCVLGAFQFSPILRRPSSQWHKYVGRLLFPLGLIASLSGIWMAQFYPRVGFDGTALYWIRILVGIGMIYSLLLAVLAIRKMDITKHRAWMIRAYALGIGAGTQVITHIPWFLFPDQQSVLFRTLCMGAGWSVNLIVAEWIIHRDSRLSVKTHLSFS